MGDGRFHLGGWVAELRARRAGQRALKSKNFRAVRHIVGPTGNMFSNGWDKMAEGADAFNRSFEPRIPPSLHISHRDSTRVNMPMPLSERCIEDWQTDIEYADPHDELNLSEDPPPAGREDD
jgi:hypothetical protein